MSNALPPSVQSTWRSKKLTFVDDIDSKYSGYRYQSYRQPSPYTSSPPRSSSPPRTPATSSRQQSHAFIRSSPEIGLDYGFKSVGDPLVDPSSWDRRYTGSSTALYYPAPRYASSIKSSHPPPSDFYSSSNYAISLASEDVEQDLPELDSEPASEGTPGHSSGVFSESEEETEDDEDSMLFSSDGYRSTFFRTSAERGQWKSDPASAFKLTQQPLLQTRRSAPTQSRVTTPTLSKPRLVSEPAINPSPLVVDTTLNVTQDLQDRTTTTTTSQEIPSPSELSPHSSHDGVDSSHVMPSLVSDRASSHGLDDLYGPLSPLPPSSPPLSPISYGGPPSRSMSILSLSEVDPDSPFMRSSSPLSELSDDDDDDFQLGDTTETVVSLPLPVDHDNTNVNSDRVSISEPTTMLSESVSLTTESDSQAAVGDQLRAGSNSVEANLDLGSSCETTPTSTNGSTGVISGNVAEGGSRPSPVELGHLSPSSSTSISSHPRRNGATSLTNTITKLTPTIASTSKCDGETLVVLTDKNGNGDGMNSTVGCSRPVFDSCAPVASTSSSPATSIPSSAETSGFSSLISGKVDQDTKVDAGVKVDGSRASEPRQVLAKRKKPQSVNGDADVGIDGPAKKQKVVGGMEKDDTSLKSVVNMKAKTGVSRPGQTTKTTSRPTQTTKDASRPVEARRISGETSEGKGKGKEILVGDRKASPVLSTSAAEMGEEERATPAPKPRKRKRTEADAEDPTLSSSESAPKRVAKSTSTSTKPRGRGRKVLSHSNQENQPPQPEDSEPLDDATKALHAQVFGLLIETMAMSRASSLAVSSLYKMMMQSQPGLKDQRSRAEWCGIFDRVLKSGEAGRGSGVFGKVESSGKDDSDRPLEAQWFYVPELDEDQERAALIRSMMPRPAKRSETKKYKQYYWRPLDKISKWDPEDEL